jgi:hypothetical protein
MKQTSHTAFCRSPLASRVPLHDWQLSTCMPGGGAGVGGTGVTPGVLHGVITGIKKPLESSKQTMAPDFKSDLILMPWLASTGRFIG